MPSTFPLVAHVTRRPLVRRFAGSALLAAAACAPAVTSAPAPAGAPATQSATPPAAGTAVRAPLPPGGWNLAPDSPLTEGQRRWVDSTLATLSVRQQIGQMVMPWHLGDYSNWNDTAFVKARRWVEEDGIGGIVWSLGTPIEVADELNTLQRLSRVPLINASDLEPGLSRLKGGYVLPYLLSTGSATLIPSNMAIGATGDTTLAYEVGRIIGREARAVGLEIAFAPVVDVNNNPSNPVINTRSFGEDPQSVARLSAAFIRGLQQEGTIATPKHFPGHGDTDTDSHLALPVVKSDFARLSQVELVPFRAAFAAGAATLMTAHIALPAVDPDGTPATLEPHIITDLLRDSLHFRGVTVTDALTMEGVGAGYTIAQSSVLAVKAGNDILLAPTDVRAAIDAVEAAVNRGEITRERIAGSARRILELKARTGVAWRPVAPLDSLRHIVGAPEHWAVAQRVAERALTLLKDDRNLVPLASAERLTVITYAPELEVEAGRTLATAFQTLAKGTRVVRVAPQTGRPFLDSLDASLKPEDPVVVTTHVRTIEGLGRPAIPASIATWIDELAARRPVVVIANGNPYVLRQFPHVTTYMVTYGIDPSLERAAAMAVLGRIPITGHAPISLPGFFQRGAGLQREARP
ncbi:MAG: glycoside hydrolase family 3 protein [Gemmatimonadaceae bacterium]